MPTLILLLNCNSEEGRKASQGFGTWSAARLAVRPMQKCFIKMHLHTWIADVFICNENCAFRTSKVIGWGSKCPDFAESLCQLEGIFPTDTHLPLVCFPSIDYRCSLRRIYHVNLTCCSFILLGLLFYILVISLIFQEVVLKSSWLTHVSGLILTFYISRPGIHHWNPWGVLLREVH